MTHRQINKFIAAAAMLTFGLPAIAQADKDSLVVKDRQGQELYTCSLASLSTITFTENGIAIAPRSSDAASFTQTGALFLGTLVFNVWPRADVNKDEKVDVADIETIVSTMAGAAGNSRTDVDGDGKTNLDDVKAVMREVAK